MSGLGIEKKQFDPHPPALVSRIEPVVSWIWSRRSLRRPGFCYA